MNLNMYNGRRKKIAAAALAIMTCFLVRAKCDDHVISRAVFCFHGDPFIF